MSDRAPDRVGAPEGHASARPDVPDITTDGAVQPFWLRGAPARGRFVRLGKLADAIITRHDNPDAVNALLAQALALTAGLAAALKFTGSFSFQARGDGAVSMLLSDCTDHGALRGYARFDAEKFAALPEGASAARMLGGGYLAFTCDAKSSSGGPDKDRYQGIVPIEGATLAEITQSYFRNSEQTETAIKTAAARTPQGWRGAALILERVAMMGGIDAPDAETANEAWRTAAILAGTATDAEMLDDALPPQMLLRRLFFEVSPAYSEPRSLSFGCRCTRTKLSGILEGFGKDDLDHMAEEDSTMEGGRITMTCEFCNHAFAFPRAAFAG
jgi:molecular chaperone Hsp33